MPRELVGNIPGRSSLAVHPSELRGILKSEKFGIPVPDRTDTEGEATKARIVYYSMYGHIHQMAEAVAA